MSVRKKGSRRIVVDGAVYLWRIRRRPTRMDWELNSGFIITVQDENRTGSVLSISSQRPRPTVVSAWGLPVVSVLPSHVATAIRQALAEGWQPAEQDSNFGVTLRAGDGQSHTPPESGIKY